MSEEKSPVSIFAIYEQRDESLYNELAKHLAPLRRLKLITLSSAASQQGGDVIDAQIKTLAQQDLLLLLVSDHLLASDAAYEQVETAMHLHTQGVRIVPLLIRPVDMRGLPIAQLVPLPRSGRPVSEWAQRDSAWYEITQGIRQVVETIQQKTRERPSVTRVAQTPAAAETHTKPSRSSLRKLLTAIFVSDVDLEAFTGDHFADVRHRFTRGMERSEKVTAVLDHVPADKLLQRLSEDYPDAVAVNQASIKFE